MVVQTLPIQADLVIQRADGNLLALVEIKNRQGLSPEIAAQLRQNLIVHGRVNYWARFFMLVSQDHGYLWDQERLLGENPALPIVQFPMAPVTETYLSPFLQEGRLSGSVLELGVIQWLWDIANDYEGRPREPELALAAAGDFLEMMRGARIGTEFEI